MSAHGRSGQAFTAPLPLGLIKVPGGQFPELGMAEVTDDPTVDTTGMVPVGLGAQVVLDLREVLVGQVATESGGA
jgi:hypothetical protein